MPRGIFIVSFCLPVPFTLSMDLALAFVLAVSQLLAYYSCSTVRWTSQVKCEMEILKNRLRTIFFFRVHMLITPTTTTTTTNGNDNGNGFFIFFSYFAAYERSSWVCCWTQCVNTAACALFFSFFLEKCIRATVAITAARGCKENECCSFNMSFYC